MITIHYCQLLLAQTRDHLYVFMFPNEFITQFSIASLFVH
jgi:hypothetical protein